jgi:murein DD-endopeptidase MepM/ murein hydrolase activator NlpD
VCSDFIHCPSPSITYKSDNAGINDILALINAGLENTPITNHEVSGDMLFNVFFDDDSTRSFIVEFDLVNNVAFITEEAITYPIDSVDTADFVESTYFSSYFDLQFISPTMNLTLDNRPVDFYYTSQFHHKAFNNTEISNTASNLEELPLSEEALYTLVTNESNLTFDFDDSPSDVIENIYIEDALIDSYSLDSNQILLPTIEGNYRLELECTWSQDPEKTYYGTSTYNFYAKLDLPTEFSISNESVSQGDMLVLTASNVNDTQEVIITTELMDSVNVYKNNDKYIAFIPIDTLTPPMDYIITASTTELNYNQETTAEFTITVLDTEFIEQQLEATTSMSSLLTDENYAYDDALTEIAYSSPIQEKLFEGNFLAPVEGRISTEFGTERYTNGSTIPSRHLAIDLAVPEGTPIAATNTGVVVLSGALKIKGNTIIIDHGMGIYSFYYHLHELYASTGALITKGDIIGTVGTTGYSTGNHLHFGIRQDGVYVNPWTLYEEVLIED